MNPRPTAPKAVALAKLRYAPINYPQTASTYVQILGLEYAIAHECLIFLIILHRQKKLCVQ